MNNQEIKRMLRERHVRQWRLADKLGISESALCRRLRYQLTDEEFAEMSAAIKEIGGERE